MRNLRIGSLQWVVGAYCCFLGAILLIAPRGFNSAVLVAFRDRSWIFGVGLMVAGVALFSVAIFLPSRIATLSAHTTAGILLLLMAGINIRANDWLCAAVFLSLSLATIISGAIYDPDPTHNPARINLVTLLFGLISAINGVILLAFPASVLGQVAPGVWDYLPILGILFIASAWLLFFVLLPFQKVSPPGSWPGVGWFAYLVVAIVWLIFAVWAIAPVSPWTDIAFYVLVAAYLIFYPWLVSYSTFPFRVSLHARITLVLGVAVAVPLIITVAWIGQREENITQSQVLSRLENDSSALAAGAGNYVSSHQAAVLAMARQPDLLSLGSATQEMRLRTAQAAFPDMLSFILYDRSGNPLAYNSQSPPASAGSDPAFQTARRTLLPVSGLANSSIYHRPVFLFGAPVLDSGNVFTGFILCEFDPTLITAILHSPDNETWINHLIVDIPGKTIIHNNSDPMQIETPPDFSDHPLAAALMTAGEPSGQLSYTQDNGAILAGYARIAGLGWYLASTAKTADALAVVDMGRETALVLLLACLAIAVLFGWWAAGRMTDPLAMLSRAANAMALGDTGVPLPSSRINEVAGLSRAFGIMRDKLALRTMEQAKAEVQLRKSKEELEDHVALRTGELTAELEERKKVEQALQEIQNRFHLVLDHSPILVFTSDTSLRYTWAYRSWAGYSPEVLLNHRDDEVLPPGPAAQIMKLKTDAISNGKGSRGEVHFPGPAGESIYDVAVEPVIDENDSLIGLSIAAMDVTRQSNLEKEMRRSNEQIEVQRRLIEHREQERLQIARDLHDGPLQELISLNFALAAAANMNKDSLQAKELSSLKQTVTNLVDSLRDFAGELRPPTLAKFGLARSIHSHAEAIQEKHPELVIHLELEEDGERLPEPARLVLFRIYQESMQNILRHAQARQVIIRLQLAASRAILEVEDDGLGFDAPTDWLDLARQGHLGLVGMRERAEAAGGNLVLRSAPGEGTWIHVQIPMEFNGNTIGGG